MTETSEPMQNDASNQPTKLSSKAVIAYLAEQFPACFILSGEPKPLKIGIFDDLAQRLADDEKVSKTRLRTALRHYTNSWRYLRCVVAGKERVDLDGQAAGVVEAGHAEHAKDSLTESREQAAKRKAPQARVESNNSEASKARPDQAQDAPAGKGKPRQAKPARKNPPKRSQSGKPNSTPKPAAATKLKGAELNQLKIGQQVQVKVGQAPSPGEIVAIEKGDIQVQLKNGLTMKVKIENIFFD